MQKSKPKLYDDELKCCGCAACSAICPVSAIMMVEDEKGFDYPVVDDLICIRCYKCLRVCPIKTCNTN